MTFFKRGMRPLNLHGMAEATRLTRSGNLAEATAEIQRHLAAPTPEVGPPTPANAAPRFSLSETLRRISDGGMPERITRTSRPQVIPAGASFTTRSYHSPHGSRDYMIYLPASAATQSGPLPLVVMLHGCTQTPVDFALGTGMNELAEAERVIVAYPMQTTTANISKCWNWFRPTDQARDYGEPAILAGITRAILETDNVARDRVYVAGLSAGGAAAVIVAQAYPDLFAAVGVHSGLPLGAAADVPSAFSAMRSGAAGRALSHAVPTIVFHGTGDQTVAVSNGRAVADQAIAGFAGTEVLTEGNGPGRHYECTALVDPDGRSTCELWLVDSAPHAWAGGNPAGSYTDPAGPDASAEMLRFFRQHTLA